MMEELDAYANALNSRVRNEIPNVCGGMSPDLNAAEAAIITKIKSLQGKYSDAKIIVCRLDNVNDTAQRIDSEVARLIKEAKNEFLNLNPHLIPPEPPEEKEWYEQLGEFAWNNAGSIVTIAVITAASIIAIVCTAGTAAPTVITIGTATIKATTVAAAAKTALVTTAVVTTFSLAENYLSGEQFSEWTLPDPDEIIKEVTISIATSGLSTYFKGLSNKTISLIGKYTIPALSPFFKYGLDVVTGDAESDTPLTWETAMEVLINYGLNYGLEKGGNKLARFLDDFLPGGNNIFGRGSNSQITKQINTKLSNKTIDHISYSTIKKMLSYEILEESIKKSSKLASKKIHDYTMPHIYENERFKDFFDTEIYENKDYGKAIIKAKLNFTKKLIQDMREVYGEY
jgi:hypothetical protein